MTRDLKLEIRLSASPMGVLQQENIGGNHFTVTTDSSFVENYSMFYLDKLINGFLNTAMISIFLSSLSGGLVCYR